MGGHHHHQSPLPAPQQDTDAYAPLNFSPGAKWIKHLTKDRLGTFTGGHFADVNLTSVLYTHRIDGPAHVKLQVWSAPGRTKPGFDEAMKQEFKDAQKGDVFGPSWTNHWWKVRLTVPGYWSQYERVQFEFDPGCEAMIYATDGTPLQGITGGFGGDRRVEWIIPPEDRTRGTLDIVVESSCNGMFGVPWNGDIIQPPDMNRTFTLASADLVVPHMPAWSLLHSFSTLRQIADSLPGNTALQNRALVAANEIMNVFGIGDVAGIERAGRVLEGVFGEGWEEKGAKVYEEGGDTQIWGIGYCHIDTAWLWPYSVTQQKVARSWSTQVDLMERYPEHRFTCSQAQQFKWLEQLYPKLFDRVKAKVLSGQFHLVGGAWVENDGNMPSGEALIRQHLLGQKYFESRFGMRCKTGWLPDSFGLTQALPQILRGSGMEGFFTQKLSWNNINTFPHTTFNWIGQDGSQVLCHMTPVDTYTAQATVGDVNKGLSNHKNLESAPSALLVFGNGDGGGGPLDKMLENLRRIRAVSNHSRDLPPVTMGTSVEDYFDHLRKTTDQGKTLPNWHGELYLEFHRGTYTSHGSIKKGNRHSEILLRDLEHVATLASLYKLFKDDYVYPKTGINDCWEKVLLNQFHDVLPGSCIGMVYDDAEKLYAEVQRDGKAMMDDAFDVLFPRAQSKAPAPSNLVGFNTTFFPRRDVVQVPLDTVKGLKSRVVQTSRDGKVGYALMDAAAGGSVARPVGLFADCMPASAWSNGSDHFVLKNSSVQLTISKGRITSLLDVQLNRELIETGSDGGLVIFQDRPNYWDAWDVEIHHLETRQPLQFSDVAVLAEGPLRASCQAQVKYGQSTINVTISLDALPASMKPESRSLFTFEADIDWRERHQFLKFELPLNIHSKEATYETQFGHIQRPTHSNTTMEAAKFEVCGHKYADLSEFGYGVAYLSESKYGFSCRGNVLRISLLRAATAPDPDQDQGHHHFSWAVMPHKGHFLESDVPMAAYLFNSPLYMRYISDGAEATLANRKSPFTVEGATNVFLETIKRGEDDTAGSKGSITGSASPTTVILRLYEAFGGHGHATLRIAGHVPVSKAYVTNMLEDDIDELNVMRSSESRNSSDLKLDFRGFEIKTVKLVIGSSENTSEPTTSGRRESWIAIDKPRFF